MSTQLMLNWKPTTQLGTAYDSEKKYKIYQQSCKIILVLKQVVKLFLVIHLFAQNLKLDKLNMPHQTTMHQSEDPAKGHKYKTFPPSKSGFLYCWFLNSSLSCFHGFHISLNQRSLESRHIPDTWTICCWEPRMYIFIGLCIMCTV